MKVKLVLILWSSLFLTQMITNGGIIGSMDGPRTGGQTPDPRATQALLEVQRGYARMTLEKQHESYIPDDPWRIFGGQTNYIKNNGVEFCGKILEVQPTGVRIEGDYDEILLRTILQALMMKIEIRNFLWPIFLIQQQKMNLSLKIIIGWLIMRELILIRPSTEIREPYESLIMAFHAILHWN
jgi:hypothetical protein